MRSLLLWVTLKRGITVYRDLYGSPMETPNTSVKTRAATDIRYKQIWPELTEGQREGTHFFEDTGMLPFGRCANARAGEVTNSLAKFDCGRGGFKLLLTKIRHTISPRDTDVW